MSGEAFGINGSQQPLDDWLEEARLPETSVKVYGRADLIGEVQALEAELDAAQATKDARPMVGDSLAKTARTLEDKRAEMEASRRVFRFRALSKTESRGVINSAPKVKDDAGDEVPDQDYVARHFLAISSVPPMSPEQVDTIRSKVGEGQFKELWDAAWGITNNGRLSVPFSPRASVILSKQSSSES